MIRLGLSRLDRRPTSTFSSLAFTSNRKRTLLADVVLEQGPLLVAHLVGRPLDVEDPVAVHLFQEPRAAAGDGLGLGAGPSDDRQQAHRPERWREWSSTAPLGSRGCG